MRLLDENGVTIVHPEPTESEVTALVNYAKAVDQEQQGLALSQLRPANKKRALVEYERIANAAIAAGQMTATRKQVPNGGVVLFYRWT